eukprot:SAG22_NODE_14085_length_385_cov_0.720280_1_plen_25_part_10
MKSQSFISDKTGGIHMDTLEHMSIH